MSSSIALPIDYLTPTKADSALAKTAEAMLTRVLPPSGAAAVSLGIDPANHAPVSVPAKAYQLLVEMLHELGAGRTIALSVVDEELTTRQAADMLGVSRPFLVGVLERGEVPYRMVGTHRRVRTGDVIEYKKRVTGQRLEALRALTREAETLGLYDDE